MASNLLGGSEDGGQETHFDLLPDVVLIEILSFLHAADVDSLTRVSGRFRQLAATRTGARNVNLSRCQNTTQAWMTNFIKSRTDVMTGSLDLRHNQWITATNLLKLTNYMVNLTALDVTGCCINEQCLHKILSTATKLRSLAYTDRGFIFVFPALAEMFPLKALSEESFQTLQRLTHLSITFLTCSDDLSIVPFCPNLEALHLDQHLNTGVMHCQCSMEKLDPDHFHHLRQYCQTSHHCRIHSKVTDSMQSVIRDLMVEGTKFVKLLGPLANGPPQDARLEDSCWASALSHTNLPCDFIDEDERTPSVRYFSGNLTWLQGMEDLFTKQFHNLQYLRICKGTSGETESQALEILPLLASDCPHICGLSLPYIHVHQRDRHRPVAQMLSSLKRLQHLAISPCAFDTHHQSSLSIFDTEDDIAERTNELSNGTQTDHEAIGKDVQGLVESCSSLTELELVYPHTNTFLSSPDNRRLISIEREAVEQTVPTDDTLSALGRLQFLQRLTLGGVTSVRHGTGFSTIFQECRQLSFLSLADLGPRAQYTWVPAFCDALKYATSLQDLRIEHNYLEISTQLQNSLQSCKKLRRLCFISEKGSMDHPPYFKGIIESCVDLCLLIACTKDGIGLRRRLRGELKKYKQTRPSLCVVLGATNDLKSRKSRQDTLKSVPNIDLAEVVYFKHHVCSPERHDSIT